MEPCDQNDKVKDPGGIKENLATTRKECLEFVWPILLLRSCLERGWFIVRTDHDVLEWLLTMTEDTGMLSRWGLRVLEPYLDVIHLAGVKYGAADVPSGLIADGGDTNTLEDEIFVMTIFAKVKIQNGSSDVYSNN